MNTYKMTLEDSVDSMTFDLLEVPIVDKDVEGAVDNTTLDGNIFTDYLWLKKNYVQKWSIMCDDEYSRLRGFYTRQFDNASVPTYKLFYGENISQDQAISGDYILVNNPTERNAPITSFELLGNAEQDGTPTPDAPQAVNTVTGEQTVKIEGKNLFDKNNADTANGYLSGSTGAFVAGGGSYATKNATLLSAGDYVASQMLEKVCHYALDGSYIGLITRTGSNNEKFTMPSVGYVRLQFPSSFNADTFQLELGSTATTYEPYQGQTLSVNLGKNLLPITATSTTINGTTFTVNSDGSITVSGTPSAQANFVMSNSVITPATDMIISANAMPTGASVVVKKTTNGTATYPSILYAPSGTSHALEIGSQYEQFVLRIATTFTGTATFKIQLESGSTATDYAPYFTPIELAKIGTYQDRIYKDEGKWYLEKQVGKVVLDGTENWTLGYTGTPNFMYVLSNVGGDAEPSSGQISRLLKSNYGTDGNVGATNTDEGILIIVSTAQLRVRYGSELSIDAWKAKLASNNMILYYALATPTTTEITNSELVGQLEAILQAYLYTGTNNVSNNAVSPNLAGQMNIGYKLIFSEETVLIEPTAVRLTLTDGGIINVCGCRQNVQLTMRETIQ